MLDVVSREIPRFARNDRLKPFFSNLLENFTSCFAASLRVLPIFFVAAQVSNQLPIDISTLVFNGLAGCPTCAFCRVGARPSAEDSSYLFPSLYEQDVCQQFSPRFSECPCHAGFSEEPSLQSKASNDIFASLCAIRTLAV